MMIPGLPPLSIKDYIIAGLAALLIVLALNTYLKIDFLFVHIEGWKPWGERMENERDTANLKLGVSNASIATLEEALAVYIGDGKARRIAGLAAIEAQAEKSNALRSQAEAIRAELETLAPDDQCRTPGFVMGER